MDPDLTVDSAFWKGAAPLIHCVSAYVGNQIHAFDWPDTDALLSQYKRLMCVWWQLSRRQAIAAQVWTNAHHPSLCAVSPGRASFQWKEWWRISHTDKRFCPAGLEGAFAIYHFVGMIGVSEALAESICSTLGRYATKETNRLKLQRIVEKTILCRGTSVRVERDDLFILRAWAEFFGGLQLDRFTFVSKDRRK